MQLHITFLSPHWRDVDFKGELFRKELARWVLVSVCVEAGDLWCLSGRHLGSIAPYYLYQWYRQWDQVHLQQVCRWQLNECCCWHNRWWRPSKGTWTYLSSIATKTSWSSTSTSARFYIRVREVPDTGKPYEEQFLWMKVGHQSAACACSPESQKHPGRHQNKNGQQATEDSPSTLPSWDDGDPGLGPPAWGRRGLVIQRDEGHRNGPEVPKSGTPLLWRQAARLEAFSLGMERLWGHLISSFHYLKRVYKREKERLYTCTDSDRTSGNSFKQKEEIFILDI